MSAAASAGGAPTRSISADTIVRDLRAGKPVVLEHAVVEGRFALTASDAVHAVFKCRDCTFRQNVAISDAKFERTVDLTGSTFERQADVRGVQFDAPALFRDSTFENRADFSLALFRDLSSFSEAKFRAPAIFNDARFEDAAFIASRFLGDATFEDATFRGAARFHRATFNGDASFSGVDFRERSEFSSSRFERGATFAGARLGDDASFLGATFNAPGDNAEAATFYNVSAARNLNFMFASFYTEGRPNKHRAAYVAAFPYLVCGRSLIFEETTFAPGRLDMQRLEAQDLILDVSVASAIDDKSQRRSVLRMIEESGKTRGDLVAANDAHYALRVDRSNDYGPIAHALDFVFYRGIAGYFVRPFRPLLILLGIVVVLSVLSAFRAARAPAASETEVAAHRARRFWARRSRDCGNFLTCLFDKIGLLRPQRSDKPESPPVGRRVESVVYRVLVFCAIIGLANSNPTLRQMVETLL